MTSALCVFVKVGLHSSIACATLKALSKVSPAEVRGLLPVVHEVTSRITNRLVTSEAAESGRLMASKVAEDLEVRIVEAVTASLRTANNPAVAILVSLLQGAGYIDTQFAVQCCTTLHSRFGADGAGAIVVVGPCGLFPMWLARIPDGNVSFGLDSECPRVFHQSV